MVKNSRDKIIIKRLATLQTCQCSYDSSEKDTKEEFLQIRVGPF